MGSFTSLLRELWAERRRVGLVSLGVFWGTVSMAFLLGFGQEFGRATTSTADAFGEDLLRFWSGSTTRPWRGLPAGRAIRPVPEDGPALQAALPEARAVCVEYSAGFGAVIRNGEVRVTSSFAGVEPAFGELRNHRPAPGGRFLNVRDEEEHRRVVFLGNRLAERLFGAAPAVGATVEIRGAPFKVVGVLRHRIAISNYNGEDRDKAYVPTSTFRDLYGWTSVSNVWVGLRDPRDGERALSGVYRVMGARHGFDPADRDSLGHFDYVELRSWIGEILAGNRIFTTLVGLFGLLVAIVGVGNVMFTLVEERRLEIGVQMALGARARDIAVARLTEGMIVTFVGGVAGLAVCALLLLAMGYVPMPEEARAYIGYPAVSWSTGLAVAGMLVVAGGLASYWPARRAAALDPALVLREE